MMPAAKSDPIQSEAGGRRRYGRSPRLAPSSQIVQTSSSSPGASAAVEAERRFDGGVWLVILFPFWRSIEEAPLAGFEPREEDGRERVEHRTSSGRWDRSGRSFELRR